MINLEEILKGIENDSITEKTTKELKELGLNDYYINKAIENGSLERISRGKYKVVAAEKNDIRRKTFHKFIGAVLSNDYEKAYDNLRLNLENQTNHDYDCHLKLYFILLKELLGDEKDFDFIDDIYTFYENPQNNTYYKHFINFTEAVLSSNFDKAYQDIILFKEAEKERKGRNCISTQLFTNLSYRIHQRDKARVKEIYHKTKVEENNSDVTREKSEHYRENYRNFERSIEEDNYEEALVNLENALNYAYLSARDNLIKMINIIKKYLEIKSSKTTLTEQEIDYEMFQDNYTKIFNKALELNDYQTVYKNIGKCVYFNKTSKTLNLYRKLLRTLIEENNKNKQELLKRDTSEKQNIKEQTSSKEEPIDINNLIDLIYNRNYEEVKSLLKNQTNANERIYYYILRMLQDMDEISNGKSIVSETTHTYKSDPFNVFKRFYEALNFKDYQEAYELVTNCIEIAERNNKNKDELTIYQYMLEDILILKEKIKEEQAQKEKIKELTKSQRAVIYKRGMRKEDIKMLEETTKEKLELSSESDSIYDRRIIEMVETLKNIENHDLDSNSFEKFTYTETDIVEKFLKAISLGDYQEAYQISREDKWLNEIKKSENRDHLIILKKLLFQINRNLENNSTQCIDPDTQTPIEVNPILENLATIKSLIKKRKFITAYNYYQEKNLEGISEELDKTLHEYLPFITQIIQKEALEIKSNYEKASGSGDYDKAGEYLDEYQEFIESNDLNRNIDFHRARLESQKIEIETFDFVKKEQLYDAAKYYFIKCKFETAIELLNEYILKDNDISAKGYLLRGRCYERIKKLQEAKDDYEKAISIIPEPNAYHRLGKVCSYRKDFPEALNCFLEYEDRRPEKHKTNLKALSKVYKMLGEEELSEKYKKLSKAKNTK